MTDDSRSAPSGSQGDPAGPSAPTRPRAPGPASPVVRPRQGVSLVWIIPLVAALAGAWLWYQSVQSQGPLITISFETGDGLVPGRTALKVKNVVVGQVETIRLSDDLSLVSVLARMNPEARPYLRSQTRFWVVRPRIGTAGISGLGTIVSGVYLTVEPGRGEPTTEFVGLEAPPVSPSDAPGLKLSLRAERLGSLDVGSPVFYRDLCVGMVENHHLAGDGRSMVVEIYIEEGFTALVRANSHFWNASGVDVSLSAGGIDIRTQSLDAILAGGVAFGTLPGETLGEPAQNGQEFWLHDSHRAIAEQDYSEVDDYVLFFEGSVRGLVVGAPVEFRGIKLGEVTGISMQYDVNTRQLQIPVYIQANRRPVRIVGDADDVKTDLHRGQKLSDYVARGMRAQLQTGNIVTGSLYIDMEFHPETPARLLGIDPDHEELPTIPRTVEALQKTLAALPLSELFESAVSAVQAIEELARAPEILDTTRNLDRTLLDAQALIASLEAQVASLGARVDQTAASAVGAFSAATDSFDTLGEVVGEGSDIRYQTRTTLAELSEAARSLRILVDYLERHPEALLQGKELP
jgi:paraquat-inducible protein B